MRRFLGAAAVPIGSLIFAGVSPLWDGRALKRNENGMAVMMIPRSFLAPIVGVMICGSIVALAADGLTSSVQAAGNLFSSLGGTWRGTAKVTLTSGQSERLGCRAYYRPKNKGRSLGLAIRCASRTGFKIELRSMLNYSSGNVSGAWEERTFNATGELAGSATTSRIKMVISGGVTGTMSVALRKGGHSVLIATQGTGFSNVAIRLRRG